MPRYVALKNQTALTLSKPHKGHTISVHVTIPRTGVFSLSDRQARSFVDAITALTLRGEIVKAGAT